MLTQATHTDDLINTRIAVLGAGAWGIALAVALSRQQRSVFLWGHRAKHVQQLQESRRHVRYLPHGYLPAQVQVTDDLSLAMGGARYIVIAVPSKALPDLLPHIRQYANREKRILLLTSKGLCLDEHAQPCLLDQLLHKTLIPAHRQFILSGPSFAKNVAGGLPVALVLAGQPGVARQQLIDTLHQPHFRLYPSDDKVGVQLCAALKNVIAIAAGICDSLGMGESARSALITRGLAEISRIVVCLGGQLATCYGLAGVGDLFLTATSPLSRNYRVGHALGKGESLHVLYQQLGQIAEGVDNVRLLHQLARQHRVWAPITAQIYCVIDQGKSPSEAMKDLLSRPASQDVM